MALSDEEKATLEALTKKANEPDTSDDFEIEIYDGQRGARVPYSKGRGYLQTHFGIDLDPTPESDEGDSGDGKGKKAPGAGTPKAGSKETEAQGYWSKRSRANRSA
jgi:hypothetical protein